MFDRFKDGNSDVPFVRFSGRQEAVHVLERRQPPPPDSRRRRKWPSDAGASGHPPPPATEMATRTRNLFRVSYKAPMAGAPMGRFATATPDSGQVAFYTCREQESRGNIFVGILNNIKTRTDPNQICADVLSAICCYIPGMRDRSIKYLQNLGFEIRNVALPFLNPDADTELVDLTVPLQKRIGYLYLGQLILIIFKEIIDESYRPFILRRSIALSAFIGLPEDVETCRPILPLEHAKIVRRTLGCDFTLKKELFEILLAGRRIKGIERGLCNYLCNILRWYQMTSVSFIIDKLVLADSPILSDYRIAEELARFAEALAVIAESGAPIEYFKIMADPSLHHAVEKNRFSTLIAVSQDVGLGRDGASRRFVVSRSAGKKALVEELVLKHNSEIHVARNLRTQEAIDFLNKGYYERMETNVTTEVQAARPIQPNADDVVQDQQC